MLMGIILNFSGQVLGPAIFGLTFAQTADYLPSSIYFLSAAFIVVSFVFINLIGVPKTAVHDEDVESSTSDRREQTLVGTEQEPLLSDSVRGRKVQSTDA